MITFIICAYLFLAVITYGMAFAYFQRELPSLAKEEYREDMAFAVYCGLISPIGTIVVLFLTGFAKHGLKFW